MKKSLLTLFIISSFTLSFVSCKKDNTGTEDGSKRETLIVGRFMLNATGEDANNNNQLDPGENDQIPIGASLINEFRADKTGSTYTTIPGGMKDTTQFTYSFLNNFTQVQVKTGTTTVVSQIIALNSTVLTAYDISTTPHRIYAFVKQ